MSDFLVFELMNFASTEKLVMVERNYFNITFVADNTNNIEQALD